MIINAALIATFCFLAGVSTYATVGMAREGFWFGSACSAFLLFLSVTALAGFVKGLVQ